jgi:hypothetical protein
VNKFVPNFKSGLGGKKQPATYAERMHLEQVKQSRCVITGQSPVEVHHCFHDRQTMFGGKRAPHFWTIPLIDELHQAKFCQGGFPIHGKGSFGGKNAWREKYGADHQLVPLTRIAIYGEPLTDSEIIEYWEQERNQSYVPTLNKNGKFPPLENDPRKEGK